MDIESHLWVFLISAAPIVELRLAIPLAINEYDLPWPSAVLAALAGNLIVVPFLLLFLERATEVARRVGLFATIIDQVFERTRRRGAIVEKYERIGLMLFVAIPLPGTGAWTGSLAALLFGVPFRQALVSIVCGVLIAAVIVTVLSLLGWAGAAIAGAALVTLAALGLWRI
ncbi:MAG: small multi-drug export [Chloroflexi bacterium]|nr:MAG: small multi-drug export [Chloroflexota bacterium]RLC93092.1 MAG: small multi-drug export [Chloroflexota bacterium]